MPLRGENPLQAPEKMNQIKDKNKIKIPKKSFAEIPSPVFM